MRARNNTDVEIKTEQINRSTARKPSRNDFFETDLRRWKQELAQLNEQINQTIEYYN